MTEAERDIRRERTRRDRSDRYLKLGLMAFVLAVCIAIPTLIGGLIIRTELIKNTCTSIQANNQIFRDFLVEQKRRAIIRVNTELNEKGTATVTISELKEAYQPLIDNLKEVKCP